MEPRQVVIDLPRDFSDTPGPRHIEDGPFSGEEFRNQIEKYVNDPHTNYIVTIILDGTYGSPVSFLEECFGGLTRVYGKDKILSTFKFVSDRRPYILKEIARYIDEGEDLRRKLEK